MFDANCREWDFEFVLIREIRVKTPFEYLAWFQILCRNASVFIPLPMIPLTELAVGNASGRADLARRNQMKVDGTGKTGGLICASTPLPFFPVSERRQEVCQQLNAHQLRLSFAHRQMRFAIG